MAERVWLVIVNLDVNVDVDVVGTTPYGMVCRAYHGP